MEETYMIKERVESRLQEKKSNSERNYGIDFLRILAMFFVVLVHSLNKGGVLAAVEANSSQHLLSTLLEAVSYCAVDLFALISGFVGFSESNKPTKYGAYIKMWLQVVFYGVVVTGVFRVLSPELVSIKDFCDMLFPVTNGLYWYFSAYTALFLVMPLLNAAVRGCSKKQLRRLLFVIFVGFSCYETITFQFSMGGGYTFVWLLLMYLIGAIMKKCEIGKNIKTSTALFGIIVLVGISWMWKIYGHDITFAGHILDRKILVNYTSPTVVGMAMLYIIGFSKVKFPKFIQKIIGFFAPATFAVYILNCQRFIWSYVVEGRFTQSVAGSVIVLMAEVLLFSFLFTLAAMVINRVRIWIFKVFRINASVDKVVGSVETILRKLEI